MVGFGRPFHQEDRLSPSVGIGVSAPPGRELTDPQGQGKGVGNALVRSGRERCDREGENAYLECLEPLVPYYERFGFEITGEIEMPEEVPDQVSMWRARR